MEGRDTLLLPVDGLLTDGRLVDGEDGLLTDGRVLEDGREKEPPPPPPDGREYERLPPPPEKERPPPPPPRPPPPRANVSVAQTSITKHATTVKNRCSFMTRDRHGWGYFERTMVTASMLGSNSPSSSRLADDHVNLSLSILVTVCWAVAWPPSGNTVRACTSHRGPS